MTEVTLTTPDGISHVMTQRGERMSAFYIETTCGLSFWSWTYAGHAYGDASPQRPVLRHGQLADCMACLAGVSLDA